MAPLMLKCHKRKPLALPPASADGRERYLPFLQITFILSQMRGRRHRKRQGGSPAAADVSRCPTRIAITVTRFEFDRVPRLRRASASRVWLNAKLPRDRVSPSGIAPSHVKMTPRRFLRSRRFRFAASPRADAERSMVPE